VCTSPFFAALVLGRLPKQLLYGDLGGTHLGSPCTNLHQPWTTSRPLFTRMLHLMGSTVGRVYTTHSDLLHTLTPGPPRAP
jgi:hypothetical protein